MSETAKIVSERASLYNIWVKLVVDTLASEFIKPNKQPVSKVVQQINTNLLTQWENKADLVTAVFAH